MNKEAAPFHFCKRSLCVIVCVSVSVRWRVCVSDQNQYGMLSGSACNHLWAQQECVCVCLVFSVTLSSCFIQLRTNY